MRRCSAGLVVLLGLVLASAPARALPPPDGFTAGVFLAIAAPETFDAGTAFTVSGDLSVAVGLPILFETSHGVSGRDIAVLVDGVATMHATTNDDGAYQVTMLFGADPSTRTIQAVAFEGTPFETRSRIATTRRARVVIGLGIEPASISVAVGAQSLVTAMATFDDGRPEDVSARAQWRSADPTIASMGAGGIVHGVGSGSTTITATFEGMDANASVTVP